MSAPVDLSGLEAKSFEYNDAPAVMLDDVRALRAAAPAPATPATYVLGDNADASYTPPAKPAASVNTPEIRCYLMVDGDDHETNGMDQFSGGRTGGVPLVALPDALAHTARAVAAKDKACRDEVARAMDLGADAKFGFAWEYLLGIVRECCAEEAAPQQHAQAALSDEQIVKEAVNRFLGWKLPQDFAPDGGVIFNTMSHQFDKSGYWPSGTNLLTEDQAKAMFEYCIAASHQPAAAPNELQQFEDDFEETGDKKEDACTFLLRAAEQFWYACRGAGEQGAVKWLRGDNGALLIYTRGEYRETLMRNIDALPAAQQGGELLQDERVMQSLIEDAVANHKSPNGYVKLCMSYFAKALAQRAASVPAQAVADGYKLVPVRATGVQREVARTKIGFAAMYEAAVLATSR